MEPPYLFMRVFAKSAWRFHLYKFVLKESAKLQNNQLRISNYALSKTFFFYNYYSNIVLINANLGIHTPFDISMFVLNS